MTTSDVITLAITTKEIALFLGSMLSIIVGAFWGMARMLVGQVEKRWDERLRSFEALLKERHSHLVDETQDNQAAMTQLQLQCSECRQTIIGRFVTTSEFYEQLGPLQNRLDRLTEHVLSPRRPD